MDTAVEFESDLFRPFLPEKSQVNPNVYGAELAFWLSRELAVRGVITSYPNYEDWGWFVEFITADGDEYWLCCSNVSGTSNKWLCYLNPQAKSFFGRNKASLEKAYPLLKALRAILEEAAEIAHVAWRDEV
ncbi:MAG: hypothetical protein H6975_04690 [Gammaproteobacteria bacterium]|nr:hypothetical protein [Gammaproteobacteria bacterium]